MNPWKLYDDLIDGIHANITVTGCTAGHSWTSVATSEGGTGIAKTIPVYSLPYTHKGQIAGSPLKQIAGLAKSWNLVEAAIGVAAIGAYYNHPVRAKICGTEHPGITEKNQNVLALYREEV